MKQVFLALVCALALPLVCVTMLGLSGCATDNPGTTTAQIGVDITEGIEVGAAVALPLLPNQAQVQVDASDALTGVDTLLAVIQNNPADAAPVQALLTQIIQGNLVISKNPALNSILIGGLNLLTNNLTTVVAVGSTQVTGKIPPADLTLTTDALLALQQALTAYLPSTTTTKAFAKAVAGWQGRITLKQLQAKIATVRAAQTAPPTPAPVLVDKSVKK